MNINALDPNFPIRKLSQFSDAYVDEIAEMEERQKRYNSRPRADAIASMLSIVRHRAVRSL